MKPISVSQADFKEVVEDNYYIDKTDLISELIKNNERSILFCRPRRFGKTLNMSMILKNYFKDLKYQEMI
jgi:hypothetical protein